MKNDEARQYFEDCGLSYSKIKPIHIRKLISLLESELIDYYENGGDKAKQMDMMVSKLKKNNITFNERNELEYAYLEVDGGYFKNRELISFNIDGFIGFAGWADSTNTEPILKAFCKWCDWIKIENERF